MIKNAENKTKFLIMTSTIAMMMIAPAVGTPNAFAAADTLPGGTAIEVTITSPTDGQMFAVPPGGTVDVPVDGTASVAMAEPDPDTTLIYVIDTSGSTGDSSGGDCGGEQNPVDTTDNNPNDIIDCEIAAVKELNGQAIAIGSILEIAVVGFAGGAAIADMTPGGGDDAYTAPDADLNAANGNDLDEVVMSIDIASLSLAELGQFNEFAVKPWDESGTDYNDAINAAQSVASSASGSTVIIAFLSDGSANTGGTVAAAAPGAGGEVFHTFAVGAGVNCSDDPNTLGSLQDIADLSGGTCTEVDDPSMLPDILPDLIVSTLDSLEIEVDGGGASAIPNSEIDPDLPKDGPAMVDYSTTATGLGIGTHEICVTAFGTDQGGEGDVTECVDIEVKEFEKFYTHTNNNWDDRCDGVVFEDTCVDNLQDLNDIGFRLPNVNLDDDIFADQLDQNGAGDFVLLGKENPKKTVVTPGQYIAVSEVTVPSDQSVWIEEDFGDCLEIGDVNPRSVPGGVQVVLVLANGDVIDIDDDLALGIGGSIVLGDTSATVHVDDVPAEATLRVMLKFGPNHDPDMVGLECTNFERLLDENGQFAEVSATLVIEQK